RGPRSRPLSMRARVEDGLRERRVRAGAQETSGFGARFGLAPGAAQREDALGLSLFRQGTFRIGALVLVEKRERRFGVAAAERFVGLAQHAGLVGHRSAC